LQTVQDKPISFEVFSDDFAEMKRQALKIAAWQKNVYVKIPITNTRRESSLPLIRELGQAGVQLNVTAILTLDQVRGVAGALNPAVASVVSVFAGRIADTGVDPEPLMRESLALLRDQPKAELLWASVREVLNIFQADRCGWVHGVAGGRLGRGMCCYRSRCRRASIDPPNAALREPLPLRFLG